MGGIFEGEESDGDKSHRHIKKKQRTQGHTSRPLVLNPLGTHWVLILEVMCYVDSCRTWRLRPKSSCLSCFLRNYGGAAACSFVSFGAGLKSALAAIFMEREIAVSS